MPRKESIEQGREEELPDVESDAETSANGVSTPESAEKEEHRSDGGWREIEAMREKAALKASLADVWDEDFDLDEEILAELDHTAEFFTAQEDTEDEAFEEGDEIDEFYDDEDV